MSARKGRSKLLGVLGRSAVVLAVCALPAAGRWATESESRIHFRTDLRAALQYAEAHELPTVVYFVSAQCQWCRKMQASTFPDRTVSALAERFVWVKIDVEEYPELAAMFGVDGVPYVMVLSAERRALGGRGGYLPPKSFVEFLRGMLEKAEKGAAAGDPIEALTAKLSEAVAAGRGRDVSGALRAAVERLAKPDRSGRAELLGAIRKAGPAVWSQLCELLGDTRLAVRAAAAQALADATRQSLPFDPFADAAVRAGQIDAWKKWVREHAGAPATQPVKPKPQPTSRPSPGDTL